MGEQIMLCYYLIPKFNTHFEEENNECELKDGHNGNHLTRLNNENYLSWGGCGCDDGCDYCGECFCYREISAEEASNIKKGVQINYVD